MTIALVQLRRALLGVGALTSVLAGRVFMDINLPADYDINPDPAKLKSSGPYMRVSSRGGTEDYTSAVDDFPAQVSIVAATTLQTLEIEQLLYGAANDRGIGFGVVYCRRDGPPQSLPAPGTGWPMTIVFYTFRIRH